MENTNNNYQYVQADSEQEYGSNVRFGDILKKCAKNWYWFLISVSVCLIFATYKILSTRPTYVRSAAVLIKESATRRLATSDLESMLSGSSGQVSSKVVNEVIAFQSPALMQEVVSRLGLKIEYAHPGLFRSSLLYANQSPVTVDFLDIPDNVPVSFKITPDGDGAYTLSKLKYSIKQDKYSIKETFSAKFGDTLQTPVGAIAVNVCQYCEAPFENPVLVLKRSLTAASASFLSHFSATSVDVKNRADVLQIEIEDQSVQRADDIINTVIAVYNENWVSDKNKMAVSTSHFINERLSALQRELGDVDQSISSYQSRNLIPDVSKFSSFYVEENQQNLRVMQTLENELYMYRYLQSYLADNSNINQVLPLSSGLNTSGVSNQISAYNELLITRNSILYNSSEKNPIVIDMGKQLETLREAVVSGVDNQVNSLQSQLSNLRNRESAINSRIAASPTQAQYLMTIGREQKVKETLYLYLLQKREENELSQAFAAYNTRVITPPMGAATKENPKSLKILLMALFVGLLIPFATLYVIVLTDDKVRSKRDIENIAVPLLGEIPQYEPYRKHRFETLFTKNKDISQIVVKEGKRDVINESFRVLRTNLEFMLRKNQGSSVILFTSFNPGSGKTFLSVNTAAVMSLKHKKVLVIDSDMRHASLSEYVKSPELGLRSYLSGEIDDVSRIIYNVEGLPNLSIIPVGALPPNPSELIASERFEQLLNYARAQYDYVLLDCPPIDIVADTQIVSGLVDRTVFVARAGIMSKSIVPQIDKLESAKNLKNVCLILNGISSGDGVYGSKYGYSNSRYDYYHYYSI